MIRISKIASLPEPIREQLNSRLHNGEPGVRLLEWLNALPEVRAILALQFGGKKISACNLTDWRKGGYQDWQLKNHLLPARQLLEKLKDKLRSHVRNFVAEMFEQCAGKLADAAVEHMYGPSGKQPKAIALPLRDEEIWLTDDDITNLHKPEIRVPQGDASN